MKPAFNEKGRNHPVDWQQLNQGLALANAISAQLQPWWQKVFGYYFLKVGDLSSQINTDACKVSHHINVGQHAPKLMLKALSDELPIACHSIDALLLCHNLEYASDPHHVMREISRVLRSDGYVFISGINPFSAVGVLQAVPPFHQRYPWYGRFFSASRVQDWLHLLGFEVLEEKRFFCTSMLTKEYREHRFTAFLEQYFSYFGAAYLIVARKRVIPLTPSKPKWQVAPKFATQIKGVSAREGGN